MDTILEEIKDILKANALALQELSLSQKDTDAKFKETDVKFKETDVKFKETDVKFKETDVKINKVMGQFTTMWGKLVESLVEGDLVRILQGRGMKVHDTSQRRKGNHNGQNFEFDIIAHNGVEIVIVEVKTTLTVDDVKAFIHKLTQAHIWLDDYAKSTIYGAVAYLKSEGSADVFAENNGLFVIRATGNSASITNADNFIPAKY